MSFNLFRAEIDDGFPRLERLFEQAKQDFWNDSTAIDWSQPLTLNADERRAMAKILSLIYYGERAALEVSAQLVPLVDDEQAKFVLACQVIEEAKHVSAFRRLLKKLDDIHPANPWVKRVLSDLVATRHASYKLVGMQLIVENIANQLFHIIHEHVEDPLIRKVLEYVGRDEKKHTGLAVLYLPKILESVGFVESHMLWAKQIYWTFCVSQAIWDHRREAAALGIDIQQGLKKGIAAQDHLVEQMGIRRGIFKSKTLESLVLSMYDRDRKKGPMDAASVKNLVEQLIPFVKKTGVLVDELTTTKVKLRLPHDATNLNPMGILHAGASFTLAETAAAAMCVMAFGQRAMFIGKRVEIAFKRPGKGDVFATSQLTPVDAQRILDEVARTGKTDAPIAVDVIDAAGEPVAQATVTMSVRKM